MRDRTHHIELLLRKIALLEHLDDDEQAAIASLPFELENVPAHRMLIREGSHVTHCSLLVRGFACRHKMARTGKRQIVAFHMAGDMMDLQHALLSRADHNLQMITDGIVGWVPIKTLKAVCRDYPRIAEAFAKDALIDASIFREWVLNVGSRDAKTRVAHMLCEFVARREAMGISPVEAMRLPMTQEQIGDATGLTAVHVNRMLRLLSEEGAFRHEGRELVISDWPMLKAVADFDAAYLHGLAHEPQSTNAS